MLSYEYGYGCKHNPSISLLLLQGAMRAAPVAGYDPLAVLAKRAGHAEVDAVASAFR